MNKILTVLIWILGITLFTVSPIHAENSTSFSESQNTTISSDVSTTSKLEKESQSETTAAETTRTAAETTTTSAETTTTSAEITTTSENSATEKIVDYGFKDPKSVLDGLKSNSEHLSGIINQLTSENGKDYQLNSFAYIRDSDLYYFVSSEPNLISRAALVQTKENQEYLRSWMMVEDIAKYVAEGLNRYYDLYSGTEIEDFYVFAQENYQTISGLYVELTDNVVTLDQKLLLHSQLTQQFLIELAKEVIELKSIHFEMVETSENGKVFTYSIDKKVSNELEKVAKSIASNEPQLENFAKQFEKEYIGTLAFSIKTGDISWNLATEDGNNVLEFMLGMDETELHLPSEEKIIKLEEFNKLVGLKLFEAPMIDKFAATSILFPLSEDEIKSKVESNETTTNKN